MLDRVPYTQTGRMTALSTRLGEDAFLLEHLQVDEAINALFEIRAAVKSQRDDLKAEDLVGSSVDVSLQLRDGNTRWWNGFVTGLHEGPLTTRGTRSYALTVRPKLWLLSQKSDCRIFQDQTSRQIVETLCKESGVFEIALRLTRQPPTQHYSVQWNETDLGYLLRRIQEDGLFYWFEHEQGRHTFVVADHPWGYGENADKQIRYAQGSTDGDHITDWQRTFAFTPGKRSGRDWDFESMSAPAGTQPSFVKLPENTARELYEYPGRFLDRDAAEAMMKNRIQATETGYESVEAHSTVRTLAPGQKFTPVDVAKPDNRFDEQVVTAIRHVAEDSTYEAGAGQPSYSNAFTVIPSKTPATPHRTEPRPKIIGSQIALIAGPSGEEIHTDQYGRVKLWFPWDRRAQKDGTDTCWIRVGQPWAGGTWGHQVIPRVGMEALVSYQDGDPDRPFVTALVPDPTNAVPYPLPDNKTRMVFRSNSYKSSGFNEMTFEDKTSGENMFFHAQKDHTTKVENNQTLSVGASQSHVIGQNQSVTVGQNMTFEAGKSINMTIGGTGAGVAPLMAPFAGMAGDTGQLLVQGLGAAANGGSLPKFPSDPAGIDALAKTIADNTVAMVPGLLASLLGILNQSGQQAQQNVWSGPSPRPDAGTALAAAGNIFGQAVGALFTLPGMHNHITGTMKTDHVGCARVEQVGTTKITHVGSTFGTKVGKTWSLTAKDATTRVSHNWSLDAGNRVGIAAVENIMLHAGKAISAIADDSMYIAAKNDITQAAKTIEIVGTDSITIRVGDSTSITITKDSIMLDAAKSIGLKAGEKIVLEAGGANFGVGPGKVVSQPMVVEGNSDIAALVGITVKNIAKDKFGAPGIVADLLGWAALKASKIPWVGEQEKKVQDYFSDDRIQQRREDPVYQGMTDGVNWDSIQWPWK